MGRRKKIEIKEPYWYNPDIYFSDLYIDGELIKPGTQLKINREREPWTFVRLVCNKKTGREWVDVKGPFGWRSCYTKDVKGVFVKKSRAKKK